MKKVPYRFVIPKNVDEFLKEFDETEAFSFDIETTGLISQAPDSRVNCIGIGLANDNIWVLLLHLNEDQGWGERILRETIDLSEGKVCIGHNIKFDQLGLLGRYGVKFHSTFDTML